MDLLQYYSKPSIWPVQSYPIAKDAFAGTLDASEEVLYLRKIRQTDTPAYSQRRFDVIITCWLPCVFAGMKQ